MTAKDYREKENWNKADFFKGEYDIDLNSIDEYAEKYHKSKLKLLGIADVVGHSEQLKCEHRYSTNYPVTYPRKCTKCGEPLSAL